MNNDHLPVTKMRKWLIISRESALPGLIIFMPATHSTASEETCSPCLIAFLALQKLIISGQTCA